ncbi:hypothetical protein Tco_1399787 [Tanacetum coccineum]
MYDYIPMIHCAASGTPTPSKSDKDKHKLDELMALCTTLQNRVLDLEKTKTTQHNEIASLKRRVKKLEKKNRSRTHKLKRLYKVGLTARVESSDNEESLDEAMFDVNVLDGEEVFVAEQEVSIKDVNNEVNVVEEVVEFINSAKLITDAAQVSVAVNAAEVNKLVLLRLMRFDDLYNNFKIVEQEVKGTASSSSISSSQNMAFVSSPSIQIQPNGSKLVYEDLEQIHEDDIEEMDLKWQLALLSMRTKKNKNQDNSRRTVNVEETSSKAMVAIDGAGLDWSYMADDEVSTNMALITFSNSEFNISEFNLATYKRGLASVEEQLIFHKKNESRQINRVISPPNLDLSYSGLEEFQQPEESLDAPLVEKLVSDDKLEKTLFPTIAKMSQSPRGNQINWNNQKSQQLGSDFVMYNKACFVCGSFNHVQTDCNYHQRERVVSRNNYTRVNYDYYAKKAHPSAHKNMVPRAVLMKSGLGSLNTARPVNNAHPKAKVYIARPMSHLSKLAQSTVKRPYQIRTTLTNKIFSQNVNTAKGKFYTVRPKAVNTARPNSSVVNAVRANQVNAVKASACWVWRPTKLNKDQGYVDSGCSRHMTGNMSYLSLQMIKVQCEFMEDMFTFGCGAKRGKITGKGTLKTGDGPKWLFDIDVLTKSMNYVPVVVGTNSNDFAGIEESIGEGHSSKKTGSSQDYILMPLWKDGSLFDSSSKNASNDEPQPFSDAGKKDYRGVNKESGFDDQERPENSTQDVNTVGPSINTASTNVTTGCLNINIVSPTVTTAPLEATHADFFGDET